jgi:hypothetical protein
MQFLIGKEVGQICLDPWSVQVRFLDGGQITIQSQFEHVDALRRSHIHQSGDERDIGPVYMSDLIQERVTDLEAEPYRLTPSSGMERCSESTRMKDRMNAVKLPRPPG